MQEQVPMPNQPTAQDLYLSTNLHTRDTKKMFGFVLLDKTFANTWG